MAGSKPVVRAAEPCRKACKSGVVTYLPLSYPVAPLTTCHFKLRFAVSTPAASLWLLAKTGHKKKGALPKKGSLELRVTVYSLIGKPLNLAGSDNQDDDGDDQDCADCDHSPE